MRRCLIAYDVAGAPARSAIAAMLEKQGIRLQKSVFLVEQGERALEKLEQELLKLLGASDSLLIMPLCDTCLAKAGFIGKVPPLLAIS